MSRSEYIAPVLTDYGTVSQVTLVGQTRPGSDVLPGDSRGKEGGSIHPGGLNK